MKKGKLSIKKQKPLTITHPNAAGIDIGGGSHYVAVPPDRDDEPVREFGSFTADLDALADWLGACGVEVVAMESTGVYWIPVFEVLESRGFQVLLVNARHVKNVTGRKSDVLDCQWLQQLMSYGLLRGAFRPADEVCALRSLWRQRTTWLRDRARQVHHLQKALTQMNIQLANVISDIVGETGQRILRAIVAGERDGHALAALRHSHIRADEETIAQSLRGNWRPEHLFALKQALEMFDFIGARVDDCDLEIEAVLNRLERHDGEPDRSDKLRRTRNAPKRDWRGHLFRMCGVDLTRIHGVNVTTALSILSEIGPDLSRFPTVKHFTSWLGLCPGTAITGGKVLHGKTRRVVNHAAQALKLAASTLRTSQSALGAYFRRMCAKMDKPKAITAVAHKLARTVYFMLTKGEAFVDQGQQHYEQQYRERVVRSLSQRAEKLGFTLVENKPSQKTGLCEINNLQPVS